MASEYGNVKLQCHNMPTFPSHSPATRQTLAPPRPHTFTPFGFTIHIKLSLVNTTKRCRTMSTGRDSAAAAAPTAPKKTLKSRYLYMYNLVSFVLWVIVLRRGAMPPPHDPSLVTYVRWTQTFALAEVFHALFGLVRAGIFTTAIQVASRLLLVWGVVWLFPQVLSVDDRNAWVYTGMLVAWGVTECVRYGYFVALLGKNGDASRVPSWLTWMR